MHLNKVEFGKKLSIYLIENGLSQKDYAERINVSNSFISAVCKGRKNPNDKILDDLGYKANKEIVYRFVKK